MKKESIFYLEDYNEAYHYAIANNLVIQEIEPDIIGRRFKLVEKPKLTKDEVLQDLRSLRSEECFPIVNRGQVWYDTLTQQQKYELSVWYNAWLDITEHYTENLDISTIIPAKPTWLK